MFDGFSGELDHAMAGTALLDNVVDATIWHINADEPLILDYNLDFGRDPAIYRPDAYRSSDHDPVIVGLNIFDVPTAPAVNVIAGWNAATVQWDEPDDGGSPITAYTVTVRSGGTLVASATLDADTRSHTFGGLVNSVTYDFAVVATNAVGDSDPGTATGTPFARSNYVRLDAGVACPTFTVTNVNSFPISFRWSSSSGNNGTGVVPAGATVPVQVTFRPRGATTFSVFIGTQAQDTAVASCR